jgi:hypothetical protein
LTSSVLEVLSFVKKKKKDYKDAAKRQNICPEIKGGDYYVSGR